MTGAVASERVSEALKGSLRMVGNHSKSAKAEGSLTATPTGGAGTKLGLSDPVAVSYTHLIMVLENIQDPGNLGTIVRTGEGAGITGVIMSNGTVDIYNPKTDVAKPATLHL